MSVDVSSYFRTVHKTSNGWKAQCPKCLHSGMTFSWSSDKNVGCCFNAACAYYYKHGGVSYRRILSFFNVSSVEERVPEVIQQSETADIKLPDEFKLIEDLDSDLQETLLSYLESRGFHRKIVFRAKTGYCKTGKWNGYFIIPVFDNGEVVYWQARRFKKREPKFYNPKSSRKGELIYKIDKAYRPKRIVLVESIFNCWTLASVNGKNTNDLVIALLGKTLSDVQMDKILMYERYCREIIIAFDTGDPEIRSIDNRSTWTLRDAVDVATKFTSLMPCVRIPIFPEETDVADLRREKAWDIINKAEIYNERNRMKFTNPLL